MIIMGRYSTFKLDFFCVGSELDIDTGWGGDQVLEFRRSQISKEHLNDTEERACKVFLQSLLLKPKLRRHLLTQHKNPKHQPL